MAAAKYNFKIEQEATFHRVITWKAGTPPVPVDLTGCTARMHVREFVSYAVKLLDLTTENGGLVLGGVAGTINIDITHALTATLDVRRAVYDLEIQFSNGAVRRVLQGVIDVSPEVTRE